MRYCYYNAHPRRLHVDDCTKRAIALATGMDYRDVARGLNEHKRLTGAKVFYEKGNPRSYVENVLGFGRQVVPKREDGTRISVASFAVAHPQGRYILSVRGHWTCLVDGVLYDTWNCGALDLYSYYEITRFQRRNIEWEAHFRVKEQDGMWAVTVIDGNGASATKYLNKRAADAYIAELYDRGMYNWDEIGDWI